ncbi:DNA topoisomerase 2 [Gracilariopsis chorda]|uniref:DNA topoisomerase 2 n=1 Tax=Gracilariopsis chorda TaxID=448386 RepID=A0A2V3IEH0_9FLOR|nr:DNA topoisomerase 2 [Gracilariopsis chorda]|eukprot:PXF40486.1 DNA topoisomerase 2 [Gracilariopsis chorda]
MALRVSNSGNAISRKKKTVEQTFTKLSQLEHILLRPDTYVGSAERVQQTIWVWDDASGRMVHKEIIYPPGLYKIFDEILVNAADHKQRDPKMNCIKVDIDAENQMISVWNNGSGIPVEIHKKEKIYVPELIFGNLLTSSNYDDDEKKVVGGRNGFGAKLANIFSTEFIVETADAQRGKRYKQVFRNNMNEKEEPEIRSNPRKESYTKISFSPDLPRFGMNCFDRDIISLLKKRVYDIAGINSSLKVYLNGVRLPIKSFKDYVNLYSAEDSSSTVLYERVSDRWEVAITGSDGQLSQVSFVNSIWTMKGGTHVSHVADQIVSRLAEHISKKNKGLKVKPFQIKSHLSLFINCLIENPSFDSQTKETLTTKPSKFGSKWAFSDELAKKVLKSEIVDQITAFAHFKQSKELSKTDGGKKARVMGIKKLKDANKAGGREAPKCTLILTEGDSAASLAISGLSVVGRDYYGVFPLRGKLLNVRDASHKQIMDNPEINNLKKILGLQHGKKYNCDTVKSLRYGHVMIMTDQDHDGSHIKGLLINFFDHFWPSLLHIDGFLQEFITPILKATRSIRGRKEEKAFFTMTEFEEWKETDEGKSSAWIVKYYKGLGTSSAKEAKEYFSNLSRHQLEFTHKGQDDCAMIDMAFSKQRVSDRKEWLTSFAPGTFFNHEEDELNFSNFVNKELILFSLADNARSIPNIMDGLKPSQRKVLFGAFKKKLFKREIKVIQLAGYVTEKAVYHHGDSLFPTIVSMAQNFVGSNNLNLLVPAGQFGTRLQGGKDAASSRYIFTKLAPVARALFPKEDDPLLSYLTDEGSPVEPHWYCPVIPTVLVNGSEGIGTGWSSSVPCYNPHDLIRCIRQLMNNEPMDDLLPWYRGFNGQIIPVGNSKSYDVYGVLRKSQDTFKIEELPVRSWTSPYKEFLESQTIGYPNAKGPFIREFQDDCTENKVCFTLKTTPEFAKELSLPSAYKKLKLSSTISTSNMVLFDKEGRIRKYDTPRDIIKEFYETRFEMYVQRRRHTLEELGKELLCLDNRQRFILMVIDGKLKVAKRKKADIIADLKRLKFDPIPKRKMATKASDEDDGEGDETVMKDSNSEAGNANNYDYLLSMPLWSLTLERVQQLRTQRDEKEGEIHEVESKTAKDLWSADLNTLEAALYADEEETQAMMEDLERVAKQAQLKQRGGSKTKGKRGKASVAYFQEENFFDDMEDVPLPSARVIEVKQPRVKKQTALQPKTKSGSSKRKKAEVEVILDDVDMSDAGDQGTQQKAPKPIGRPRRNRNTKPVKALPYLDDSLDEVSPAVLASSKQTSKTTVKKSRRSVKQKPTSIAEEDLIEIESDDNELDDATSEENGFTAESPLAKDRGQSLEQKKVEVSDDDDFLSLSERLARRSTVKKEIDSSDKTAKSSGSRRVPSLAKKKTAPKRPRSAAASGSNKSVSLISPSPSPQAKKTRTSRATRTQKERHSSGQEDEAFSPDDDVKEIKPTARPRRQRTARKIVIEDSDSDADFDDSDSDYQ